MLAYTVFMRDMTTHIFTRPK